MFLSIHAQGDDSGDRSPWGDFWFTPVPFRGSAYSVTGDAALRLTAVYACVRVLAESVSMLPFMLYKEAANGAKTPDRKHWLYQLFGVRPNGFQNPMEFREMLQAHCALRGNAFARMVSNGAGEVTDLLPLHPDRVTVEMLSETNWRFQVLNSDGSRTPVNRGEMFHLRGLSGDGVLGYNPIQAAREAIATGLAAQDYGMRYFQNDATPGGWIEFAGQFKDDEQRRQWRERWQETQTGRHRHKTAVLELGMKYHQIAITNQDSQFLETRKFSVSEIARLFRIPPHLIGDLDKATFSNIEMQSIEFVNFTLMPWLVRWEEAIRFTFLEPDDGLDVEFPVQSLLRGDAAARATYYHNGILDGWLVRNEARKMESLNPIDGLDEPLRPLNMVEESKASNEPDADDTKTAGNAPAAPVPPVPATNPAQPATPKPAGATQVATGIDATADLRFFQMAAAVAERVARKEVAIARAALTAGTDRPIALREAYQKHAPFMAQALSVPLEEATAYCNSRIDFIEGDPKVDAELFTDSARMKLTQLALRGSL